MSCHAVAGGKFGRSALSSARWRLKTLREDVELMAPEHCVSALGQVCQQGMQRGGPDVEIITQGKLEDWRTALVFFSVDSMRKFAKEQFAPGRFGKEKVIMTNVDLSRIGLEKTSLLDHQMIVDSWIQRWPFFLGFVTHFSPTARISLDYIR